jgi:membrane protein CcdC involved in cytochrome C biogenesis
MSTTVLIDHVINSGWDFKFLIFIVIIFLVILWRIVMYYHYIKQEKNNETKIKS